MCRCASIMLLGFMLLAMPQGGLSLEQAEEDDAPFQWLAVSGETSGVKYPTRSLQPLSATSAGDFPVDIEREEKKVDAQTTRITHRIYLNSVNGERVLFETVVEDIRKMPGDRVSAVRTTSRRDPNGRFVPLQQEIQEMAPSGTDAYSTKRTLLVPGLNGELEERERVQQTERRKGDQSVEIDRTLSLQDQNGRWSTAERRVSQNALGEDEVSSSEQVYTYDVNNRRALSERIEANEWKDANGQMHRQSESYTTNLDGKFQLTSRTTMLQRPLQDGQLETTEIIEESNPAAPREGLRLIRKTVENLQVLSATETERQLEVLEPDLNGRMQSVYSENIIEVK